jgi:uncharacterized protein (DUF427 family)
MSEQRIRYPSAMPAVNHVEPAPRRVRAVLGGETVFDTVNALYVWERPFYPQYYIPVVDVRGEFLVPEGQIQATRRGPVEVHALRVGQVQRPRAAKLHKESPLEILNSTVRCDWRSLDAWFEEDEQVFVHPRSPYVRVDALRSTRRVRVELEGAVLADSTAPVMVFETGLPTRYYFHRTQVDFEHLLPSDTETECPYKGVTSGYWAAQVGDTLVDDVAWTYDFPTRELLPIAGLIAFYNEKADLFLDDQRLERPHTHLVAGSSS